MSQTQLDFFTKRLNFPKPNQFIYYDVLFEKESKSLIAIRGNICYGELVYKYLFSNDSWMDYTIPKTMRSSINDHKILLLQLSTNRNKCKLKTYYNTYKFGTLSPSTEPACIMIEDCFHYIADKHIKYNINTKKYELVSNAPMLKVFNKKSLIRIKDKLMIIGGTTNYRNIYEYDINKNRWRRLSAKLPSNIWVASCTHILNGQIILISAMNYNSNMDCNNIYIYEVNTQIINKSKINLPLNKNQIFAINTQNSSIVAHSWTRNLDFYFPTYLIKTIQHFCIDEVLHTINTMGDHYKIDVFKILNNY